MYIYSLCCYKHIISYIIHICSPKSVLPPSSTAVYTRPAYSEPVTAIMGSCGRGLAAACCNGASAVEDFPINGKL